MSQVQSAVVYDGLPMSSGGAHSLGRMTTTEAATRWLSFLGTRTRPAPILCSFDLDAHPWLGAGRRLGARISREFPPTLGARTHFSVPPDRITEAVDLLESLKPLPTSRSGLPAVTLTLGASFKVLAPDGAALWPGQDPSRFGHFHTPAGVTLGASTTRLSLDARASISLLLSVPEATDEDLSVVIPWLQDALPMRLSPQHWARWTLTKDGHSYRRTAINPLA